MLKDKYELHQLTCLLPVLHKCLKQSVMFTDDKVWDHQPTLWELYTYLIGKIKESVPRGCLWFFNEHWHKPMIEYVRHVPAGPVDLTDYNQVPLEWLPLLRDHNPGLHDIVVATIAHLSDALGIWIIDKWTDYVVDGDFESMQFEDDEYENSLAAADIKKYKPGGVVMNYSLLMRQFKKLWPKSEVIRMVHAIKANTKLKRNVKNWLKLAIPLIEDPAQIEDFVTWALEQNDDGDPLTIKDSHAFCWSFYDKVAEHAESWRNDHHANFGMLEPAQVGRLYTDKHVKPQPVAKLYAIREFFAEGRRFYFTHYSKRIERNYAGRRDTDAI